LNLHWSRIALNCRDQRTTEEFYQKWIGFERARAVPLGEEQTVFPRQGDAYLELFHVAADTLTAPTVDGPQNRGSSDMWLFKPMTWIRSSPGSATRFRFPGPAQLRSFYPRMAQRVVDRSRWNNRGGEPGIS
jgi:catechol 2,3-dioxygenase-like lactoylglutathione lyase family enzyme